MIEQAHLNGDEVFQGSSMITHNSSIKGLNAENQIRMSIDDTNLESPIKSQE